MSSSSSSSASSRIPAHFEASLSQAAGSLTGRDFSVAAMDPLADSLREMPAPADTVVWQQSFAGIAAPALWISAGRDLWETVARITLEAAGLDSITEQDARSAWKELLAQTVGGIASGITADILREVNTTQGEELNAEPPDVDWHWFTVTRTSADMDKEGGQSWQIRVAWSLDLEAVYESRQDDVGEKPHSEGGSKTFDLLLEVSLPVSVSFGRTALQIREVLKLSTGSIVELNRFVSDPVDVIVNDCVIARGEVVVVDGNYGVRINQLATREDRLRTGMVDTPGTGART